MDPNEQARRARAELRAQRLTRVEAGADVPLPPEGLPRLQLAFMLSRAAWLMSGNPWPAIPRGELPIHRIRRDHRRDETP